MFVQKSAKHAWGAAPRPRSLAVLDTNLDFSPTKNLNPYCAQIRSQGSHRRICPFPPPPFPMRERGPDGLVSAGRQFGARGMLGFVERTSRKSMVMVCGAGGLQEKGGRSPPPKRGRPGGGRCAAAPYKHRLAHAPGGRRPSGRAFRCVGFLGRSPE